MIVFFFNSISLLSLFITIILAAFFSITNKGRKTANKILSILLVLFAIQIIYSFSVSDLMYMYFLKWHKTLFLIRQTGFLSGPLIYFYIQAHLTSKTIRLNYLVHTIPFLLILLFLGSYYYGIDNFVMWNSPMNIYDTILILIHNLVYIILSLLSFRVSKYSIVKLFKKSKLSPQEGWIQLILLGFIILWTISLYSFASYMVLKKPVWCAQTGSIYGLTLFLFLNSILFLLLLKPDIYCLIEKYRNTDLDDTTISKHKQSLIQYIDMRKPYLEPEISLEDIAKGISINPRLLSQIINQSFEKNFKSFMNEYRINESLHQLADKTNTKTIKEILFDSGFNSLSVFYTEFKKNVGLTPQQYRKSFNK